MAEHMATTTVRNKKKFRKIPEGVMAEQKLRMEVAKEKRHISEIHRKRYKEESDLYDKMCKENYTKNQHMVDLLTTTGQQKRSSNSFHSKPNINPRLTRANQEQQPIHDLTLFLGGKIGHYPGRSRIAALQRKFPYDAPAIPAHPTQVSGRRAPESRANVPGCRPK